MTAKTKFTRNPTVGSPRGVFTTEFWLTITTLIAASILAALGTISPELWAGVAGLSGGTYSISRGLAK